MKTLITGATGLVGNNMVRTLIERGGRVRVLVRNREARSLEGLDLESYQGDVRDAAAVAQAARGVDLIIHAAARVKIGRAHLEQFREVNVEGTRNVANAARENAIRLVHVSSTDCCLNFTSLVLAHSPSENTRQVPLMSTPQSSACADGARPTLPRTAIAVAARAVITGVVRMESA